MSLLNDCVKCLCTGDKSLVKCIAEGVLTYLRRKRQQRAANICVKCCFSICNCCCPIENENNANNGAGPQEMKMDEINNSTPQNVSANNNSGFGQTMLIFNPYNVANQNFQPTSNNLENGSSKPQLSPFRIEFGEEESSSRARWA